MTLTLSDLAAAIGGTLDGPDGPVGGWCIDSREASAGDVFVALVGERDGHDFAVTAIEAGATALVVERPLDTDVATILVDDARAALADAAAEVLARRSPLVVGITGSVGKTSVKDLAAAGLSAGLSTSASVRSFNNELGVPLTILNAPADTQALVVEMGARGPGQIAELCAIAAPTIGVVTRVAEVHTEVFGDIEAVARTKGELIEAIPAHGAAILNLGDERVSAMAALTPARVIGYGRGGALDARDVELDGLGRARCRVVSDWGEVSVELSIAGRHMVDNALAALGVCVAAGVDINEAAGALARASASPWRMEITTTATGALVVNDSYNANPTSVGAALEALVQLPRDRRIAVLGEMAELGPDGDRLHREVAERAEAMGVEVYSVGAPAYGVTDLPDIDAAAHEFSDVGADTAILVKGSRVAGLERLAARLV